MVRLLILLALAGVLLILPPMTAGPFWPGMTAMADDDDDDDDDGDDDDDDYGNRSDGGRAAPRSVGSDGLPQLLRRLFPGARPAAPQPAPQRQRPAPPPPVAAADEIVTLALDADDLDALLAQGFALIEERTIAAFGTVSRRLRIPAGLTLEAARDLVRALPSGQDADFNHFYRAGQGFALGCRGIECPARTAFGWALPDAADRSRSCGAGLRIGIVDTGINADHHAFADAALTVEQLAPASGAESGLMHGTAVAALLIGRPDSRSPGLVPAAEVVAVDAFYRQGGDERADVFTLAGALDLLAGRDVQVMNLSFAGPENDFLEAMIRRLIDERDIVVVAAAGNDGPRAAPRYPAAIDPAIAVTAVDRNRNVYRRAVQGVHIDLAAPGVDVWTAASIRGARPKTGTSFAAPFVTAAAGLLRLAEPGLSAPEVKARLMAAAEDLGAPGLDPVFGAGLVPAVTEDCRVSEPPARLLQTSGE